MLPEAISRSIRNQFGQTFFCPNTSRRDLSHGITFTEIGSSIQVQYSKNKLNHYGAYFPPPTSISGTDFFRNFLYSIDTSCDEPKTLFFVFRNSTPFGVQVRNSVKIAGFLCVRRCYWYFGYSWENAFCGKREPKAWDWCPNFRNFEFRIRRRIRVL